MYIIQEIMQQISKPISKSYNSAFKDAMDRSAKELFEGIRNAKMAIIPYPKPYPQMNLLLTTGCEHKIKKGNISGCSMCNDNMSNMVKEYAMIRALREKDVNLYAEFVRLSFLNKRGFVTEQMGNEVVTGCDSLDETEFPEQVFDRLFGMEGVYKTRPFRYSFEVRAESITKEKLQMMKRYLGKGRTFLEIGVEVTNEWLRNHWINKSLSDSKLENAIGMLHEEGFKVNTNILLGIPCLTEEQSIMLFRESVIKLMNLKSDRITFHPLTRKPYTINHYLFEHLKDNPFLKNIGITDGEHTGLPWMFSIIEAMAGIFEEFPKLSRNFGVGQFNIFEDSDILVYNADRSCSCNKDLFKAVDRAMKTLQTSEISEIRKNMKKDPCYKAYEEVLERQKNAGDIRETLGIVGKEMIASLWDTEKEIKTEKFLKELDSM